MEKCLKCIRMYKTWPCKSFNVLLVSENFGSNPFWETDAARRHFCEDIFLATILVFYPSLIILLSFFSLLLSSFYPLLILLFTSFYPPFILLSSSFYPPSILLLSSFHPPFTLLLSPFYPPFILLLSPFYLPFILL